MTERAAVNLWPDPRKATLGDELVPTGIKGTNAQKNWFRSTRGGPTVEIVEARGLDKFKPQESGFYLFTVCVRHNDVGVALPSGNFYDEATQTLGSFKRGFSRAVTAHIEVQ